MNTRFDSVKGEIKTVGGHCPPYLVMVGVGGSTKLSIVHSAPQGAIALFRERSPIYQIPAAARSIRQEVRGNFYMRSRYITLDKLIVASSLTLNVVDRHQLSD